MFEKKVIVCRVGQPPVVEALWSDDRMNQIVGGFVENVWWMGGNHVAIAVNGEGMLDGLPKNLCGIHGDFLVVGYRADGETRGLSPDEIRKALKWLERHGGTDMVGSDPTHRIVEGAELEAELDRMAAEGRAAAEEWRRL